MKHIKSQEDYLVNEELKFSWKGLLIGLGIALGINHYFGDKSLTNKERDEIIADITNVPSEKENEIISKIRKNLINDIQTTNNLDSIKKQKLISAINEINFVCVDTKTMYLIGDEKNVLACYFKHYDEKGKKIKAIIVDKSKLNTLSSSNIIIHELRHLLDDILIDDTDFDKFTMYSEYTNVVDILDKDIVLQNKVGKKKLQEKIDFYSKKLVEMAIGCKIEDVKSPNDRKRLKVAEDEFRGNFESFFTDEKTNKYLTSPSEVYVRFHGLKRWMIKNGYLKDMNDLITQDKIIKVLNDEKLIKEYSKTNLDFYEFLFFLDVDFNGKVPHDMKKVNSIVANYTDYMKDRTIV